jgi:hypothetical protein
MGNNLYLEADSRASGQGIPLLYILNVHYRDHKNPPLNPTFSRSIQSMPVNPRLFKIHLIY